MDTNIKRESMVFYESFFESIVDLEPEDFKKCACAILNYGLNGIMPEMTGVQKAIFVLVKPQIDKNNQRWENAKKKGSKCGTEQGQDNFTASDSKKADCREENNAGADDVKSAKNNKSNKCAFDESAQTRDEGGYGSFGDVDLEFPEVYEMCVSDSDYAAGKNSQSCGNDGKFGCGEYSNVYLTCEEKSSLEFELGSELYSEVVRFLSRYIKRKPGYVSACHFEDLRGWVKEAVTERQEKSICESSKTDRDALEKKIEAEKKGYDFDFDDICENFK